jgi:hypothetical protein
MIIWRTGWNYINLFKFVIFMSSIVLIFLAFYLHSIMKTPQVILCKNEHKVVINLRNGFDFLKRFPKAFECNKKFNNSWTQASMSSSNDTNYDYSKPAPKHSHKIQITRAIAIQFPIKATKHYLIEFKWLYHSWLQMMKFEPAKWRTDLVVFIENKRDYFEKRDFFLNELNCRFDNIRKSAKDPPMCTLIDYRPFSKRDISFEDMKNESLSSIYKHLIEKINIFDFNLSEFDKFYKLMKREVSHYSYLDSIIVGFEGYVFNF